MMEETVEGKREVASHLDIQRRNLNIIDLSIAAAHEIGADKHPVALADLHAAYLRANPGISKGTTQDGFEAGRMRLDIYTYEHVVLRAFSQYSSNRFNFCRRSRQSGKV